MKKKMLMRFAAVALAAGMCISCAGATYFSDVSSNAWYYDAVTKCSNYNLMYGSVIKMYRKWIGIIWLLQAAVNDYAM